MIPNIKAFLSGKKTYLIALAGLLTLVASWSQGNVDNHTAIQDAMGLLFAMTGRAAIAKVE